jgi:hypothetical protein
VALTFSPSLTLALGSQILLEFPCADLVLFNLLTPQFLDLFEELRDFVGHDVDASSCRQRGEIACIIQRQTSVCWCAITGF